MVAYATRSLVILLTAIIYGCGGGGGGGASSDGTSSGDISNDVTNDGVNNKSVSLSWILPDTREDGEYLQVTSLQGVRFYYGETENDLQLVLDLEDIGTTDYTLTGLKTGEYYFGISIYDKFGLESDISNLVLKEII
ncbi:MAG: hypothetical protein ABW098_03970 [Candidatus Thiodiazotropha sp.]